jgi:hypothetical protein
MSDLLLFAFLVFSASPSNQTQTDVFAAADTVTGAPPINDFKREWYSKHLIAMGESRLPEGPGQTFRFLWLRSFDHPIAIRVACIERTCKLTARRLGGRGGYEPGSLVERKARTLSERESARFRALLTEVQFWGQQPPDERIGLDGAQWVLEGRRGQDYHVWEVWSPETSGPFTGFRQLCLELLRLSGLTVRPSAIY